MTTQKLKQRDSFSY